LLILFDEIDAIALDRINSNDLREMGRVTSTILKELDNLNEDVVLIATTNLFEKFDRALVRRFDSVIDFNRYEKDDLIEIAEVILNFQLKKFKNAARDMRIFKKIISFIVILPLHGLMKYIIKISLAISYSLNEFYYLRRLLQYLSKDLKSPDLKTLTSMCFTLREIQM